MIVGMLLRHTSSTSVVVTTSAVVQSASTTLVLDLTAGLYTVVPLVGAGRDMESELHLQVIKE